VAGLGADQFQRQQEHQPGGGLLAAGQLTSPVEPTDSQTFSLYGIKDFTVQGWDGAIG
jgi:hypothetical protein